jgi:hypothetical protein
MALSWRRIVWPCDAYCNRAEEKWFKSNVEAVRMPYRKKTIEKKIHQQQGKEFTPRSSPSPRPQAFNASEALE